MRDRETEWTRKEREGACESCCDGKVSAKSVRDTKMCRSETER